MPGCGRIGGPARAHHVSAVTAIAGLVQRTVTGVGGTIVVGDNSDAPGALFTVLLPQHTDRPSRALS